MLRFMRNKILIPLLIVAALAAFFSFRYSNNINQTQKQKIIETVTKALEQGHFSPRELNDSFSAQVYNRFINRMDYDRRILTQADIDILSEYEFKIDDEIKEGSTAFYDKFTELYDKGSEETEKYYKEILAKPFDYTLNEEYTVGDETLSFPKDAAERKDRWRKYLKSRALSSYVSLKKTQQQRIDDNDTTLKETKTEAEIKIC